MCNVYRIIKKIVISYATKRRYVLFFYDNYKKYSKFKGNGGEMVINLSGLESFYFKIAKNNLHLHLLSP